MSLEDQPVEGEFKFINSANVFVRFDLYGKQGTVSRINGIGCAP